MITCPVTVNEDNIDLHVDMEVDGASHVTTFRFELYDHNGDEVVEVMEKTAQELAQLTLHGK